MKVGDLVYEIAYDFGNQHGVILEISEDENEALLLYLSGLKRWQEIDYLIPSSWITA